MSFLEIAKQSAQKAGKLLREHFGQNQLVNEVETHDIKLQMDVDCQRLIESCILDAFPDHSIVGEEESHGNEKGEYRWVVDPLDGTVNYTYAIPHFCVSVALQRRNPGARTALGGYESIVGVIYDPMRDELFWAEKGKGAYLNGKRLTVSPRAKISEAILSVGFAKTEETINEGLHYYKSLVKAARKIRTMGSAALDLAYVAAGRMDMYLEFKVRLWDIGAGILLVEEAGGTVEVRAAGTLPHMFETMASNGKIQWREHVEKSE